MTQSFLGALTRTAPRGTTARLVSHHLCAPLSPAMTLLKSISLKSEVNLTTSTEQQSQGWAALGSPPSVGKPWRSSCQLHACTCGYVCALTTHVLVLLSKLSQQFSHNESTAPEAHVYVEIQCPPFAVLQKMSASVTTDPSQLGTPEKKTSALTFAELLQAAIPSKSEPIHTTSSPQIKHFSKAKHHPAAHLPHIFIYKQSGRLNCPSQQVVKVGEELQNSSFCFQGTAPPPSAVTSFTSHVFRQPSTTPKTDDRISKLATILCECFISLLICPFLKLQQLSVPRGLVSSWGRKESG